MKRFLYKEVECCGECPLYYMVGSTTGEYYDCNHPEMEISLSAEFCMNKSDKEIHSDCPLPKELGIEIKITNIHSGNLVILKIPENLKNQRDSIVKSTQEALEFFNISGDKLLVVIDSGTEIDVVSKDIMNKLGWYRKDD